MKKVMVFAMAIIIILLFASCEELIGGGTGSTVQIVDEPVVVGFVYPGPVGDGGYTQTHHDGTLELQKAYGDSVKCIWIENVDETDSEAVQDAVKELIGQGAEVVIGASPGFGAPMVEMAESGRYNNIVFMYFSGDDQSGGNYSNYYGAIEEPGYLSGIIAGMQTEANKIGYVAAYQNTEAFIGVNAFALGAQSVNPEAAVHVVFTNSRYDPAGEGQAVEALLEQGCDIIAQNVDSMGPQLAAAEAGVFTIGYNRDNAGFEGFEDSYLTAPVWYHGAFLIRAIGDVMDGVWSPEPYYGNMQERYVALAPMTKNVSDEARAVVEDVQAAIMAGYFPVFQGPIYDNQDREVVAEGVSLGRAEIRRMGYLVWGVVVEEAELAEEEEEAAA